ncbi:MAG: hypothetical protein IJQ21_04165 [Lachnospiraceae bacterium]|nr:hypothetical protein [Lachnospiraceae bacterium]
MKRNIINAVKFILFVCLALLAVYAAMLVTEWKNAHAKYHDFFANTDKIDILLYGNSHVINGINPLRLYEASGYSAYNMGGFAAPMNATYWTFMNTLDHCTPKVVVIDTNLLYRDYKYIDRPDGETSGNFTTAIEQLHLNLDCFPDSETKRNAIEDLLADETLREQFYFPASTYHSRWPELTWNDFLRLFERDEHNRLMGAEMNYGVARNLTLIDIPEQVSDARETVSTTYLRRILDECRARNITAVITYLPYAGMVEDYEDAKIAKRIAAEYDFPFLDFMDLSVRQAAGIDLRTDMIDSGHLNVIGADKVTAHLAAFLQKLDHPELTDHRGDPAYDSVWGQRLEAYETEEAEILDEIEDPFFRVALIPHKKQRTLLFVQQDSVYWHDADMVYLIHQISGTGRALEAAARNESYLLLYDGNAFPVEAVGAESFEDRITFMGKTSYVSSGAFHNLFVNDRYENNFLDMDEFIFADMQTVSFGENIAYRYFEVEPLGVEMFRR